jgi:hypothetical protein
MAPEESSLGPTYRQLRHEILHCPNTEALFPLQFTAGAAIAELVNNEK